MNLTNLRDCAVLAETCAPSASYFHNSNFSGFHNEVQEVPGVFLDFSEQADKVLLARTVTLFSVLVTMRTR